MDYNFTSDEFIELKGKKVYLKRLSKEVRDDYFLALDNISIDTDKLTGTGKKFVKSEIEKHIEQSEMNNERIDFLIYTFEEDKLIGEVCISDKEFLSQSASLRVAIFDSIDFNKGYGSEGIILCLSYGFGMMNLNRIELDVFDYNERGIHVYEKIGFKKEGTKREAYFYNHRYHDMVIMSMLAREFRTYYCSDF